MGLVGSDFERIGSVPLFRTLSDISVPTLLKSALLKHVPARTLLFAEADCASSVYTLMEGAIELFSQHNDRRSHPELPHARHRHTVPIPIEL
jgi:hypothetical protein